ncbi:MAG: hypothetical protein ACREOB_12350, partial [Thermodesulfobacteriota bacterium]
MGLYQKWQKWRFAHPRCSMAITVIGGCSTLIGIGGTKGNIEGWGEILDYLYQYIPSLQTIDFPQDWVRWAFLIVGMSLIFLANDIPGKLMNRWHHLVPATQPEPVTTDSQEKISILVGLGTGGIYARFENKTGRPVLSCRYVLSNLQEWSVSQKLYLIKSKAFEPVYISAPKTLEPETPYGICIVSRSRNELSFDGIRNERHQVFVEPARDRSIWRALIQVVSKETVISEKWFWFKVEDKTLNLWSDPEIALLNKKSEFNVEAQEKLVSVLKNYAGNDANVAIIFAN